MAPRPAVPTRPKRRFRIHEADPRSAGGPRTCSPVYRTRTRTWTAAKARARLRLALQGTKDSSLARGTKITQRSQLTYWAEFCRLYSLDKCAFRAISQDQVQPSLEQLKNEEETLAAFMAFVIACPRTSNTDNTASCVLQCISAVRSHYGLFHGRKPGLREDNRTGGQLRSVIRGFQKTNPSPKQIRLPILQQHRRAIRRVLELQNNGYHKALWALWLTLWQ